MNNNLKLSDNYFLYEDDYFDGASFEVNESFVRFWSHSMEVPVLFVYAPGSEEDTLPDDVDETTIPAIAIMTDDEIGAYEEFKSSGNISNALVFERLNRKFLFRGKTKYFGEMMYFYGFDITDDGWENMLLCIRYPMELVDTEDERRLMEILDHAAVTFRAN